MSCKDKESNGRRNNVVYTAVAMQWQQIVNT
jgi:hypothetical protein